MGFLDKLKKTLWNSFFGKPERESKTRSKTKKKARAAQKKRKPSKKSALAVKRKPKKVIKKITVKTKPPLKVKPAVLKTAEPKTVKLQTAKSKLPRALAPAKAVKPPAKAQLPQGVLIGHVTHFFSQVRVAAIKIEAQNLSVGDEIQIKGATTHFKTKIDSMQINRVPVTLAPKGSEIGILVKKRVREGDEVYKL